MNDNVYETGPIYFGEFELMALLAAMRLGEDAYGVTIREAIAIRSAM
jgi:hypothetical protein